MCSNITGTVHEFLQKYDLLNKDEPILIAFSGGTDSLCLLDIALKLNLNITAIHLNHNWRGDESLKDAEFCREFCQKNGINFYTETLSNDVPHTETAAREARYEFFENAAKKFNSEVILTAHNANDNAETILYRIAKGTGTEGLSGIREKRGIYYRPLIHVLREKIEDYCRENNLTPNIDSSNNDVKYKRNLIRHKIIPLLETINKDAVSAINSLSEVARAENAILNEYIENINKKSSNSTQEFIKLSKPIQNKIIYNLLKMNNLDYDRETIASIVNFINKNSESKSGKQYSITKNLWLYVNNNEFYLISPVQKCGKCIQINKEGIYDFENSTLSITKINEMPQIYPADSDNMAFASFDDLNFTLRFRQNGDIIQPLGSSGTQKLKKYLNTKKIPNHKKDLIPLLCSGNEVLWVCGYGISEKIKVEKQPVYMLKLTNKKEVGYGN